MQMNSWFSEILLCSYMGGMELLDFLPLIEWGLTIGLSSREQTCERIGMVLRSLKNEMLLSLQENNTFHVQNQSIVVSYITIYDYYDLQISGNFAFGGHLIHEIEVGVSHLQ